MDNMRWILVASICLMVPPLVAISLHNSTENEKPHVRVIEPSPGVKCYVLNPELRTAAISCLNINAGDFIPHGDF